MGWGVLLGLPTVTGENGSEACDARLVLKSGGVGGGGGREGVLGPPHRPLHLPGGGGRPPSVLPAVEVFVRVSLLKTNAV